MSWLKNPTTIVYLLVHAVLFLLGVLLINAKFAEDWLGPTISESLGVSLMAVGIAGTVVFLHVRLTDNLKDKVRVLVLNACFSEAQAKVAAKHIGCAVGMRKEITEKAARTYVTQFYQALGFGQTIEKAHDLGKTALVLENISGELTPRLILGRDIEPAEIRLIRKKDKEAPET